MTAYRIKYFISLAVYTLVCIFVLLVQSTGIMTLQLGTASAVLILPMVLYCGFYFGEYAGAGIGLFSGAITDSYSATLTYSTVALTVLGFTAGVVMSRLFNRNIAAAVVLNLAAAFVYFFAKWVTVYAFSDPDPLYVLFNFTLPSVLYTAALGFVIFFVMNPIFKNLPKNSVKR